ncbi:MAG: tyrosine-type recombinase/integrase [Candidatus Acidiferrum sp.]
MTQSEASPSFSTLLQDYFTDRMIQQRSASPQTVASYRDTFRLLLRFAHQHAKIAPCAFVLTDLNAPFILAFLRHLELDRRNSARTRNVRLAALRSFLKYASLRSTFALPVIQRALAIPMKRFDRTLVGYLSRQETQEILDAPDLNSWCGQRDRVLFATLYNTGARVSEIIGLRVHDVVLAATSSVHILGKGRKERTVPLWPSTSRLVRAWLKQIDAAPERPLFPNRSGYPMTRSNVADRLRIAILTAAQKYPELLKRKISPHSVRHSTAMHLLQSGIDLSVIALWLGHESPATTHTYMEADLTMKEQALSKLRPPDVKAARFKPPDRLLQFLASL